MPLSTDSPWDSRDEELNLRDKYAALIAAQVSGIDPAEVTPDESDYEVADMFGVMVLRLTAQAETVHLFHSLDRSHRGKSR